MIMISYFLKYIYNVWFENEKLSDKEEWTDKEESADWAPVRALEGDEVKEEKGFKILTPSKLLIRLPVLLA